MGILERGPTMRGVLNAVANFVATFIRQGGRPKI
jgi:hypothetical protein